MLLDTPICEFGRSAPDFSLPDPSGQVYTLKTVMGKNGMLVAFICNHCPYVHAVIDRLVVDAKQLQEAGIGVTAIMPNDFVRYRDDNPENMVCFSAQHHFTFPYLIDETQAIAKTYGAVCTPDFFGFNAQGGLQYRGRLDDAGMGDASGRNAELLDAMLGVAATGQGPKEQAPSMGCSIKWK